MPKPMCNGRQRQYLLRTLKKGPDCPRDLIWGFLEPAIRSLGLDPKKLADRHMEEWRDEEANKPIPEGYTFLY